MARKRNYTVSDVLDAVMGLSAAPETPPEWRIALSKCFTILIECDTRVKRNDVLRTDSKRSERRTQLENLIRKYQAQHDREVPLGNKQLAAMMDGWKAELAQLVSESA